MRLVARCLVGLLLLGAGRAAAQYRPPPPPESQRLLADAEALRAEAASREARGDRKGADERYAKAIATYRQVLAADPQSLAAAAGLGAACIAARQYELAARALEPVHRAAPAAAEVSFPLAISLFKLRRFDAAVPLLQQLSVAGSPAHFMVHYYLGSFFLAEGDGERAAHELGRFLEARPSALGAGDAEILEMLGRAHLLRGDAAQARAAFARAQRGRAEWVPAQLGLASVLELEGNKSGALALLDGLASRHPAVAEVRERVARLNLARGDLPRALAAAQEALRLQRSAPALSLVGDVELAQKDWPKAEARYREALAMAAGFVPAELGLAAALQGQGRFDDAVALLEKAGAARPGDRRVAGALGSALRRAGKYQRAVEVHAAITTRWPRQPDGYLLLGADHFATGRWDEAIADYGRALELDPSSARARHLLALALVRRLRSKLAGHDGLVDDAALDARRAFDLEPSPATAQTLGALLLAQRRFDEAERVLARGVALPGHDYRIPLLQGYARLGAGDAARALASFEDAAKLCHDAAAESEVYLGWALAKIELGELELAAERLQGSAPSPAVSALMQANLRQALLRLAVKKLADGAVADAAKDLAAAEAVPGAPGAALANAARLIATLLDLEGGKPAHVLAGLRAALGGRQGWFEPATRPLLEAYALFRMGRLAGARKQLAQAARQPGGKAPFAAQLGRAIAYGEAARAYRAGQLKRAQQLLASAAAAQQLDPRLAHDLACVRYRSGDVDGAVAVWRGLADAVPEAELALGIVAQERQLDARAAIGHYQRFLLAKAGKDATCARGSSDCSG